MSLSQQPGLWSDQFDQFSNEAEIMHLKQGASINLELV